jgi:hypothetical protein
MLKRIPEYFTYLPTGQCYIHLPRKDFPGKKEVTVCVPPCPKINADDGGGAPKKSGNCEISVFDMHHKSLGDHLYISMVNGYQRRDRGEQ